MLQLWYHPDDYIWLHSVLSLKMKKCSFRIISRKCFFTFPSWVENKFSSYRLSLQYLMINGFCSCGWAFSYRRHRLRSSVLLPANIGPWKYNKCPWINYMGVRILVQKWVWRRSVSREIFCLPMISSMWPYWSGFLPKDGR